MGISLGPAIAVSATLSAALTAGLVVYADQADRAGAAAGMLTAEDAPAALAFDDTPDRPLLPIEVRDGAAPLVPGPAALIEIADPPVGDDETPAAADAEDEADLLAGAVDRAPGVAAVPTTLAGVAEPLGDDDLGGEPAPTTTTIVTSTTLAATSTTRPTPVTTRPVMVTTITPATTPTTAFAPTTVPTTRPPLTTRPPVTTTPTTRPTTTAPTTTTRPVEPVPVDDGYRLVWSDEFEFFDNSKWTREWSTYGDGNNELQCYLPENVTIVDGHLRLTATNGPAECSYETRDYGSGMVRTQGKVDWTQGRFEVRARMPEGQGFWPAAWMSPSDGVYGRWPNSGEIDIVEALGHRTNRIIGSLHWMGDSGHRVKNREYFAEDGFITDWHVYSLTWEDGLFIWEVDGIEYHRVDNWSGPHGTNAAPFDQPFYLKLNLAVGGRAPGSPDPTTPFPAHYDIDWVRVYQR